MTTAREVRDDRLQARAPAALRARIQAEAKAERRSEADMLVILAEEALNARDAQRAARES